MVVNQGIIADRASSGQDSDPQTRSGGAKTRRHSRDERKREKKDPKFKEAASADRSTGTNKENVTGNWGRGHRPELYEQEDDPDRKKGRGKGGGMRGFSDLV